MFSKKLLDYFKQDELAASIYLQKYALRNNADDILEPTPTDMFKRISKEFARIQKNKYKNPLSEDEIFNLMEHFKYIIPQGSPLFGIGNDYQIVSLANCFVVDPPKDSYGAILKTDEQIVQLCKRRGGVGTDLSNLRPSGHPTRNAAKTSTGVPAFMERYSNSINEVGQSGRRGALMLTLSCFSKNNEVLTNEGWLNITNIIQRVENGDELFAICEQGKQHLIKNPFTKEPEQLYELETTDGTKIEVTGDHKFEVQNQQTGEVYLKAIKDIDLENEFFKMIELES